MLKRFLNLIQNKEKNHIGEHSKIRYDKDGDIIPKLNQYSVKDGAYYSKPQEVKAMLKYIFKKSDRKIK